MIALEHPEDALERAITGTLSAEERQPLEQHLAICAACQAHLALASVALESFEMEPHDLAADRLNVERAMSAMSAMPSPLRPRVSPVRKRVLWLSAAALLAMGGLAAAAWLRPARTPREAAMKAQASQAVPSQLAPPRVADEPSPSEVASTPAALEVPTPAISAPSAAAVEAVTASALFRKASALRANGESDAAIVVFQKLQKLFPQSRESRLSLMIAGRLLLDRGRPAQALDEFDRYLSEGGAASEHALAGRAAALQGLGQSAAEASAWQRLLAAYPGSVYDQRAKARLSQLQAAHEP